MNASPIDIQLPSLIRRIGVDETKLARQVALNCNCHIKRIRRSRNWRVTGEVLHLQTLLHTLQQQTQQNAQYLVNKIEQALKAYQEQLEPVAERLKRLVQQNHNITLAELMHLTDCSIAEARSARFAGDAL